MNQLRQEEHQKYFFGICSSEVYNTLEKSLKRSIEDFVEKIEETLKEEHVSSKEEIEKEVEEIKALYMRRCMNVLGDFKNVLNNIFEIPESAQIYPKSERKSYTDDDVRILREKVSNLDKTFIREKMFLEKLQKEKEFLDKLRPIFVDTKVLLEKSKNKTDLIKINKLKKLHLEQSESIKNSVQYVEPNELTELGSELGI